MLTGDSVAATLGGDVISTAGSSVAGLFSPTLTGDSLAGSGFSGATSASSEDAPPLAPSPRLTSTLGTAESPPISLSSSKSSASSSGLTLTMGFSAEKK